MASLHLLGASGPQRLITIVDQWLWSQLQACNTRRLGCTMIKVRPDGAAMTTVHVPDDKGTPTPSRADGVGTHVAPEPMRAVHSPIDFFLTSRRPPPQSRTVFIGAFVQISHGARGFRKSSDVGEQSALLSNSSCVWPESLGVSYFDPASRPWATCSPGTRPRWT